VHTSNLLGRNTTHMQHAGVANCNAAQADIILYDKTNRQGGTIHTWSTDWKRDVASTTSMFTITTRKSLCLSSQVRTGNV
jgi:hypothetical protein